MTLDVSQSNQVRIDGDLKICGNLLLGLDDARVIGYSFSVDNGSLYTFNRIQYLDTNVASGLDVTTFECA